MYYNLPSLDKEDSHTSRNGVALKDFFYSSDL